MIITKLRIYIFYATFVPITRLEAIRILLAYSYLRGFKLFQIDVKSVFINIYFKKEVYVQQPPAFIDYRLSNHIIRLDTIPYDL